jgi:hypothetical protein
VTDLPISDAIRGLRVEAATAGGRVQLSLAGLDEFEVSLSSTYYDETPEGTMGGDLARAVRLLSARREDAVRRAGLHSEVAPPAGSRLAQELADFNREADEWSTEVVAPDGSLRVSTVGMREFVVEVESGARRRHSVTTFCDIAGRVGSQLIRERVQATMRQRIEYARRAQDARALGLI